MKDGIYTLVNASTVAIILMGTFGQIDIVWTVALGLCATSLYLKAFREFRE